MQIMAADINKTFATLAGFLLLGAVAAATQFGLSSLLFALFACYMMLVATNAISRGENHRTKR
jgi:hypothetical protein